MGIAKQQLLVALATAVLTACGGGGGDAGGGPPPPPPPPPPAPTSINAAMAWRNFMTTSQSWTVSGVASDNQSWTLRLMLTPGTPQVFPLTGQTYATTTVNLARQVGLFVPLGDTVSYFDANTHVLAGNRNVPANSPVTCSLATIATVPPNSAAIGSSGALHTFNDLDGCLANSPSEGTSTTTWSVESENSITFFCLNTTWRNGAGQTTSTDATCVQSEADGTLGAKARITSTNPLTGFTLTARN